MTYPQQPSDPQYPQYQQPSYPPPTMQPAPPAGTSVDFSAINRPENRPYLIAGIGGLVALLAYFILPFYSFSYHFGSIAESSSLTGSSLGGASGWLYLTVLGSLVALVVAALMALNIRAISQLTPMLATRIIIGAGAAAVVGLLLYFLQAHGASTDLGGVLTGSDAGFSAGVGFGFWIALLASIAIIVGGVMQMRRPQAMM